MSCMVETMAARIQQLPPYLFAKIDEIKQNAKNDGIDLIDLGVGDPDLSPPKKVVDSLIRAVGKKGSHNYSSYSGLPLLRQAFAGWFERRFGVSLDPESEVLPLLGSKEGIGHIFLSHVDTGDDVLVPDPGYPVYTAGAILAGARPRYFPLRAEKNFLPDIDELETIITPNARMMWLNYPSNPTTRMAGIDEFRDIVAMAENHDLLVCHDMAYSEMTFNGEKAASILQVPSAKNVCVEFHSLSKTFCMPGWRVGFAAGNAKVIQGLAKIKTNLDSGIFMPIQEAAIVALTEGEDDVAEIVKVFESRRTRFVAGLNRIGWKVPLPAATFYVWAPVPSEYDSMEFCTLLLGETGIVCTPGTGFGNFGEGFIRMSLTVPQERLDVALERLAETDIDWS